jgi:Xaa-Pro aminopeptidase
VKQIEDDAFSNMEDEYPHTMKPETSPTLPTQNRLAKLRENMRHLDLDTFLVLIDANRRYLSGYSSEDGQFDETAGALLITHGTCLLATDSRYDLQARREATGFEVVCYRKSLYEALPQLLRQIAARRVGFESARMTVKHHQDLVQHLQTEASPVVLVAAENQVESLRACKDADEIVITRRAVACAEKAFRELRQWMRPGMTESEVARKLKDLMVADGAESPSFPIIVAAGPNSAMPHAVPGDRPIKAGEPVLLDWGAKVDGYCSDISRTVVFGNPDAQFRELYAIVREAQASAVVALHSGAHGQAVDTVARKIIKNAGFGDHFGHSLGHGTGLMIHEAPRLSPYSDDFLKAGMIVTVEPGIYLPDWGGIRLENQALVTESGAEILNTLDLDDFSLTCP